MLRITALLLVVLSFAQQPAVQQDTEARARAIVAALVAGDFAKVEAQYDEQMAKALPPGAIAASWNVSASQLGSFESVTSVQTQQAGAYQVAVAVCVFKNYSFNLRMVFNDKGQLVGLTSVGLTPRAAWAPPDYANAASLRGARRHDQDRAVGATWRPHAAEDPRNASGRRPGPRIRRERHGREQRAEPHVQGPRVRPRRAAASRCFGTRSAAQSTARKSPTISPR